jgi:SpoVK/Ycf46/Vps4 family AAA+-type ATPase
VRRARALHRPQRTGKSLATRLLAARLGIDLYRIELTVVSKFIGETERNLDRIFRVAEEQDVILVLDEGDALLAPRTGVSTSVDRYANLETNFLLQRLESFEGILLITTNAADRIDPAFERRMDVTVAFRAPDAFERRTIWDLHLPPGHEVPPALLDELAERCVLSGGQIRNAVMHASLTALDGGGRLRAGPLEDAVRREYRKSGASCPLRRGPAAMLRSV